MSLLVTDDGSVICSNCKGEFPDTSEYVFWRKQKKRKNLLAERKQFRECKSCISKYRKEQRKKLEAFVDLKKLFRERINRINYVCAKNNWECDFDSDYLQELYDLQKGLCAISGICMTAVLNDKKHFSNVSVDRIDSTIGYIKSNIQLVCAGVNIMKHTFTVNEFIKFCNLIVEHNK